MIRTDITCLNLGNTDSEASDPPSSNGTRVLSSSSNTENEFLKFYMGVSNIRKFFLLLDLTKLKYSSKISRDKILDMISAA